MKRPDIIALPTSQMRAFCDLLRLPPELQSHKEDMIVALEKADFSSLKLGVTHQFKTDTMSAEIVAARRAALGRD